ncbi:MAG: hypothetical protein HYU56_05165 [Candidatus Aenigmarchaeota archaeon]|nr:hypothetical protein [Candidatus Aenigmarchaeota archaeon]
MARKNTCVTCPTSSKAGIALLLIGFALIFVLGMKLTGIALILLSYAYPFIKSKMIGKKR